MSSNLELHAVILQAFCIRVLWMYDYMLDHDMARVKTQTAKFPVDFPVIEFILCTTVSDILARISYTYCSMTF